MERNSLKRSLFGILQLNSVASLAFISSFPNCAIVILLVFNILDFQLPIHCLHGLPTRQSKSFHSRWRNVAKFLLTVDLNVRELSCDRYCILSNLAYHTIVSRSANRAYYEVGDTAPSVTDAMARSTITAATTRVGGLAFDKSNTYRRRERGILGRTSTV